MKIGNIDLTKSVYIIAEAGSNHNGDLNMARELIRKAKEAGADAVKFQSFRFDSLYANKHFEKVLKIKDGNAWASAWKKYEFKQEWYKVLKLLADDQNIHFISTPYDFSSFQEIKKVKPHCYKIASGDFTFHPLIKEVARSRKPIILSTGLSTMDEIEETLKVCKKFGNSNIALLHCIVEYPTSVKDLNLSFIQTLKRKYGVTVGFSDHTESAIAPAISVAMGARIIEKHFTLDNNLPGWDHKISFNPVRFKQMVNNIREAEISLGSPVRRLTVKEKKERVFARRSLYAIRDIRSGEILSQENIGILRPAIGLPPKKFFQLSGKKSTKNFKAGQKIN